MAALIEYDAATPEVRAIYDEIMQVRGFHMVPAFYKALARDPKTLRRFWNHFREVMDRPRLSPLEKELIGIAVSITLGAQYAIESHIDIAKALGMDEEMLGEVVSLVAAFSDTAAICRAYSLTYDGNPVT